MGKRYHNLWQHIVSFDNLCLAFHKAARGKRSGASVADFEYHLEANLVQLRDELRSGDYQPGSYSSFLIHDPKQRLISACVNSPIA